MTVKDELANPQEVRRQDLEDQAEKAPAKVYCPDCTSFNKECYVARKSWSNPCRYFEKRGGDTT